MSQLQVDLVAADRKVWSGEAKLVRARTSEGELGIMPGHQPLLGVLVSGDVTIQGEGGDQVVTVDSGFLSVEHNRVTIVADTVEAPEARV
ncbi:F0F1 ATP synthase subunit epsilon [Dermatophilaceae bacterium Soc4.6]